MTSSFSGGFLRDDASGALVAGSVAPLTMSGGFLRDANEALVCVTSGTNGQVQAVRADAGVFTASQTRDVTITWPVAFADANYTVVATLVDVGGTANNSAMRQIQGAQTASGITVRIAAGTTGYTDGQLLIHAIAIHD